MSFTAGAGSAHTEKTADKADNCPYYPCKDVVLLVADVRTFFLGTAFFTDAVFTEFVTLFGNHSRFGVIAVYTFSGFKSVFGTSSLSYSFPLTELMPLSLYSCLGGKYFTAYGAFHTLGKSVFRTGGSNSGNNFFLVGKLFYSLGFVMIAVFTVCSHFACFLTGCGLCFGEFTHLVSRCGYCFLSGKYFTANGAFNALGKSVFRTGGLFFGKNFFLMSLGGNICRGP